MGRHSGRTESLLVQKHCSIGCTLPIGSRSNYGDVAGTLSVVPRRGVVHCSNAMHRTRERPQCVSTGSLTRSLLHILPSVRSVYGYGVATIVMRRVWLAEGNLQLLSVGRLSFNGRAWTTSVWDVWSAVPCLTVCTSWDVRPSSLLQWCCGVQCISVYVPLLAALAHRRCSGAVVVWYSGLVLRPRRWSGVV